MVNWCIVGCGSIAGARIAPALGRSEVNRLVAVVSRDEARATAFAEKHRAERSFGSLEAMLRDPAIEVVYLGTPNALHEEQAVAAFRAGKHVFCDKPMALTVAGCSAMIQESGRCGPKLGVGFDQRYNPPHQEAQRRVRAGAIGEVLSATMRWGHLGTGRMGWRQDPALAGGGAVWDMGIHGVDLLRFLLGREVCQVAALLDTVRYGWPLDEGMSALLEFEGGVHVLMNAGTRYPYPQVSLEILGSAGKVVLADTMLPQGRGAPPLAGYLEMADAFGTHRTDFAMLDMFQAELDAFGRAVRDGLEPEVSGPDGLRATEVVVAMQDSARLGKTIRLR